MRIGSRTPAKLAAFGGSSGIPAETFAEVARWAELLVLSVHGTFKAFNCVGSALGGGGHGKCPGGPSHRALCRLWCTPGFRRNHWTHAFRVRWA